MKRKERAKRFLALLLAFTMIFTSSSMNVLAATIVGGYKNSNKQTEAGDDTQAETQAPGTQAAETNEDGSEVRQNTVTFATDGHAHIVINGATVDSTANAKDGKIVFDVVVENGYAVESVLVDKSIPARTQEDGSYIIEGILTDETTVDVTTVAVETESESEIESETEAAMPEFTKFGTCDGITANVHAEEGVFPEGTELELKALTEDQKAAAASAAGVDVSQISGLDVTFIYEGKEVQPKGEVSVTFTTEEIGAIDVDTIYHEKESGVLETISATQEGNSLGFTADSFSPMMFVKPAEDDIAVASITGPSTVSVGQSITLTGTSNKSYSCYYSQTWKSYDEEVATVSGTGNTATVTGIKAGSVTIKHTYCDKSKQHSSKHEKESEEFTIKVVDPVVIATRLELPEKLSVDRGQRKTITPTAVEPENAVITWRSSDETIATVDSQGKVKGIKPGTVTISAQSGDLIATTELTVKGLGTYYKTEFYYLKTPTSDKDSNSTDQWGKQLGGSSAFGTIDLTNAQFDSNKKNCYDNVAARVVSWPDGSTGTTYSVPKNSDAWKEIYSYWKEEVNRKYGVSISSDDITSMTLIPYKISNNERFHVDCTIDIVCDKIVTAKYYLLDAGSTQFDQVEAESFVAGKGTTNPKKNYPAEKTVDNKKYAFKGWYTSKDCNESEKVTFPQNVGNTNLNFYAKYVRSDLNYTVKYYWNGTTEKVAESKSVLAGEPWNSYYRKSEEH